MRHCKATHQQLLSAAGVYCKFMFNPITVCWLTLGVFALVIVVSLLWVRYN